MKIASLIFIVLILSIAFRYTKIFDIEIWMLIAIFILWLVTLYIQIHLKNKDRDTPRPVYMT